MSATPVMRWRQVSGRPGPIVYVRVVGQVMQPPIHAALDFSGAQNAILTAGEIDYKFLYKFENVESPLKQVL